MRSLGLTLLAGASMLATACASNPPPEPTPPPVVAEAPRVAPTPPTPLPTTPVPTGPAAGSKGDFAAKSTDRVYFLGLRPVQSGRCRPSLARDPGFVAEAVPVHAG